jgi:type II secretory pathway pseudopilin PulG
MRVRLGPVRRSTAGIAAATLVAGAAVAAAAVTVTAPASADPPSSCHLGNGVQHVINIVFDNVHFFRDNPNVPSDLEQMPTLLNFLKSNGTVFSNVHTPLIAHTANDSLSIYTGLYGDRHGQPLTNSYKTYNPNGTTDPAASFAYWTSPVADTASTPAAGHDTTPTMVYSDKVPATGAPNKITPAPWVPFTRAGCSVGDFSTANMVLENAKVDIPTVFGANSPEVTQLNGDSDPFKDPEVADYVGEAIHCAKGDAICANAQAVKFGQTTPSPSAAPDVLPTEPGGYNGYQALFGHRYIASQLGAGTPNLTHNGYQVTNAAGNLVDLKGNQINGAFLTNHPGFPGFSPVAPQSLAMMADMQEAGVPVTYGYISDLHERKAGTTGACSTSTATGSGKPLGPGDNCYVNNAKAYDQAFATFFQRLAADGITPANTEFVISAEENDQFAGANVGRAVQPTPAGCDGVTTPCNYNSTTIGELAANINGLLSTTSSSGTQFDIEPQGAAIYVHGQPAANDPTVRQLERDTAAMTGNNPYTGNPNEHITKYQAGALEQRILHMQSADPLRTPTYTLFPMPDYFFGTTGANVAINSSFAYDHGYYSPNIDITWAGIAGPGAAVGGVDGPAPAGGNESQDPNSLNTVPQASTQGTWVEETDLRPTLLNLVGLHDDYQTDGRVISQALASPSASLTGTDELAAMYQQLNSSVGAFATDTLIADSAALATGSATDDSQYVDEQETLQHLAKARDQLAAEMKVVLAEAAEGSQPSHGTSTSELARGRALLRQAHNLAANS